MKHLKIFERAEDTQMGITTEEVRECFYDLSDEGWVIIIRFAKNLKNARVDKEKSRFEMDLIPNLEIKIHKKLPMKVFTNELMDLENSEEYKGCISLLNSRLEEHNLVISKNQIERLRDGGSQIFILIYRKSDENYIK